MTIQELRALARSVATPEVQELQGLIAVYICRSSGVLELYHITGGGASDVHVKCTGVQSLKSCKTLKHFMPAE